MMRQEMEQLHEQQMQQSARDAAYMSERTALLSPVAHDNNIEELRGQISSLIGMMEDLSHK